MGRTKWEAHWIWAEGTAGENNVFVEARKTFSINGHVKNALLRISANQSYKLFINGSEVGRGPAPADLAWMMYDEYEVSRLLVPGENVIAVAAHNFGPGEIVTKQLQGPGGLICQLDIGCTDGASDEHSELRTLTIASGPDWKCRRSPRWVQGTSRLHSWGGYREISDMNKEDGWEGLDYTDEQWPGAFSAAKAEDPKSPWPRLIPRDIPLLKETLLKPKRVVSAQSYDGGLCMPERLLNMDSRNKGDAVIMDASAPGSLPQVTYDFGREVVGYPELQVTAEEGGVIQFHYGESLEMVLTDTFLLRKGMNFLAPFGRRAFRYMKISAMGTPKPLELHSLSMRFVHYPYEGDGYFRCSSEKLNNIWETGKYTTMVNSQHHFEDCPYREGALWVADAVVMAKVVYQTYNGAELVRKSLLQSARIQNEDGSIPGTGPLRNPFLLPDFCAHWLFGVHEYFEYSNDRSFLEEVWPAIRKLASWFEQQEDTAGLFSRADREGMWCFIDWSEDIERKDRVAAINCFYYKFLITASKLAQEAADTDQSVYYRQKAEGLRSSIRKLLRSEKSMVFADCLSDQGLSGSITAQTNFAAAWSGVMDKDEIDGFVKDYYLEGSLPPIRGAFFYHIVLETLFEYGYADEAVNLISSYWGDMLDRGATTWWETFDPLLPFSTVPSSYMGHTPTYLQDAIPVSLCHGWGASPTYLLSREVAGIDISKIGERIVTLKPAAVSELDWAEGAAETRYGTIRARWSREPNGEVRFRATVPGEVEWTAPGLRDVTVEQENGVVVVRGIA